MRTIKFSGAESAWFDRLRSVFALSAVGEFRSSMLNHFVQAYGRAVILASGIAMVWFGRDHGHERQFFDRRDDRLHGSQLACDRAVSIFVRLDHSRDSFQGEPPPDQSF